MKKFLLAVLLPLGLLACNDDEDIGQQVDDTEKTDTVVALRPDSIVRKDMTAEERSFLKSLLAEANSDTVIMLDSQADLLRLTEERPDYIDFEHCSYIIGNVMLPTSACFVISDSLSFRDGIYFYDFSYMAPAETDAASPYAVCNKYGKLDAQTKLALNVEKKLPIGLHSTNYEFVKTSDGEETGMTTLQKDDFAVIRTEQS
ncbi:MAG: hypothetical protein NC206_03645 [Bacteroides sp.]|nr:hypothetical protein [Roseburia sp.]MCM1346160.1 hypothetical protein [Bacteroides sp.]MCM1420963.1 hypothetical protein [Bacteroides sp.]